MIIQWLSNGSSSNVLFSKQQCTATAANSSMRVIVVLDSELTYSTPQWLVSLHRAYMCKFCSSSFVDFVNSGGCRDGTGPQSTQTRWQQPLTHNHPYISSCNINFSKFVTCSYLCRDGYVRVVYVNFVDQCHLYILPVPLFILYLFVYFLSKIVVIVYSNIYAVTAYSYGEKL